jgi:probable addiction module antidote protein
MPEEKHNESNNLRDNPVAIAQTLNEAFATNDLPTVMRAINAVMRAQNVVALAETTGLRRDRMYKSFGGSIDPQLGRVMALLAGMDVQITVQPLPPREKLPRRKAGRPRKRR